MKTQTITPSARISILRNSFERIILPKISKATSEHCKVLEIGCSTAKYSACYSGDYIGLDLSDEEMRQNELWQKAAKGSTAKNCKFVVGDALFLPFKPATFDVIICNFVIEHVCAVDKFMKQLTCGLKKGGTLLVSCPTKRGFRFESEPRYRGYDLVDIQNLTKGSYLVKDYESWGGVLSFIVMAAEAALSKIINPPGDDRLTKCWNAENKFVDGQKFGKFMKIRGAVLDFLSVIEIKTNAKDCLPLMNYFELKKTHNKTHM